VKKFELIQNPNKERGKPVLALKNAKGIAVYAITKKNLDSIGLE